MNEQNSTFETNLEEEQVLPTEGTGDKNSNIETGQPPPDTEKEPDINKDEMEKFDTGFEPDSENFQTGKLKVDDTILKEITSNLYALNETMEHLQAEFKSKLKYDQYKEKIIDDLHKEVQGYKNDLIKNLLKPLIMDIIHTIDDTTKLVNNHRSKDTTELDPLKLIKQMEDISSDLDEILFRQGLESFNCEQEEFDPGKQKIIKTETTGDQSKDKTISKRVHKGYMWDEKMLRREMVNVYVYKPGLEIPETNINKE
ncbi:MAG: nucleotide exchange factor GrpE [Candidatus Aminicenantes bacterium]|nr:nucleotide exchange factor GrpE [Candidatus Aminicenantes bacterium]